MGEGVFFYNFVAVRNFSLERLKCGSLKRLNAPIGRNSAMPGNYQVGLTVFKNEPHEAAIRQCAVGVGGQASGVFQRDTLADAYIQPLEAI